MINDRENDDVTVEIPLTDPNDEQTSIETETVGPEFTITSSSAVRFLEVQKYLMN